MFKDHLNSIEMNELVEHFSPILNFTQFTEYKSHQYAAATYIAKTNDEWSIYAYFTGYDLKSETGKYYFPTFQIEKNKDKRFQSKPNNYTGQIEDKETVNKLINHFHDLYKPNYSRAFEIIDIFLEQGISMGIYNVIKKMPHDKHSRSQFGHYEDDKGYNRLFFDSSVIAKITFNNLLQTLRSGETKFKKSHLSIDIIYLVSSDNRIKPYFKIKLPYSSHKKINCILSFDAEKIYIVSEDKFLKKDYIDNLIQYQTDKESLVSLFKSEFKQEIINIISKTLKIKKNDLIKLTDDELRSYFTLIEMIKL